MLDHAVMWSYHSIWKPSVTPTVARAGRRRGDGNDEPAEIIAERDAFEMVMGKARIGAAPRAWTVASRVGHA